jgi:hypothetical protein
MNMYADRDVLAVLQFMQANIPCGKLVPVSEAVAPLAKSLWGHHNREAVLPVSLSDPTSSLRLAANG